MTRKCVTIKKQTHKLNTAKKSTKRIYQNTKCIYLVKWVCFVASINKGHLVRRWPADDDNDLKSTK